MKLVVIYGPPASGKLTVAEELARITGLKVFHNHATRDIVNLFMESTDKRFQPLLDKYRLQVMENAAKEGVPGLIFTFVYVRCAADDKFVRDMVRVVEKRGGSVCFVRLVCNQKTLEQRVTNASRKLHGKIKTRAHLKEVLEEKDTTKPMLFVDSFVVDTERIGPKNAARLIKRRFRL